MTDQELVIIEPSEYAIVKTDSSQLQQIIRDNIGGQIGAFDLDRCKVPAGGGTNWELPTLEGIQEIKELQGVIVHFSDPRAYWEVPFDESGGGSPPDCSSTDGYTGRGVPGGECQECPLAAFGSAPQRGDKPSRGQACKQMRFLFLARPDSIIPLLVVAPPTSLRELKQYFIRMAGEMVNFASVVTELTLVKDKNSDGITYSRIVPRMVKRLSETEYARVKEYADALRVSVSTVDLNREDWNSGGGEAVE
jgi:hypothetical protein